MQNLIKPMD